MPVTKIFLTERIADRRKSPLPGLPSTKVGDILYDFDGYPCKVIGPQ